MYLSIGLSQCVLNYKPNVDMYIAFTSNLDDKLRTNKILQLFLLFFIVI